MRRLLTQQNKYLALCIILMVTTIVPIYGQKKTRNVLLPPCTIDKSELQKIRGLYLGMAVEEAKELYPTLKIDPEDKDGVSISLYSPLYSNDKSISGLNGISSLDMDFYKGRLYYFWIYYSDYGVSSSIEHMKNISASLNLPYRWNYKSQTMRCNGFSIGAPVYGSAGLIVDDDLVEREIKNEKIKAERAEKQKKIDEQKHRSVFHP